MTKSTLQNIWYGNWNVQRACSYNDSFEEGIEIALNTLITFIEEDQASQYVFYFIRNWG